MSGTEKYSYTDEAGRTVHVFEDEFGNETKIIEYGMFDHIFMGEQWCPYCLRQMKHKKRDGYWECPDCGFNITDAEVIDNNGIPTLAAALDFRDEHGLM